MLSVHKMDQKASAFACGSSAALFPSDARDCMPKRGFRKANPLDVTLKVLVTEAEAVTIARHAAECGMPVSKYLRKLAMWDIGQTVEDLARPVRTKARRTDDLIARLSGIHAELRRFGNNANQLARQANTGFVPLRRTEIEAFQKEQQVLFSAIKAAMEQLSS